MLLFTHKIQSFVLIILFPILLTGNSAIADSIADSPAISQAKFTEPGYPAASAQAAVQSAVKPKQSPVDFSNFGGANTQEDSQNMWLALRQMYFFDRPIIKNKNENNRILIQAPGRAENDAMVPVLIELVENYNNSADPFKKVYLIVDVNPAPLAGLFTLSNNRVMEQLKTSVRVNGYTFIRAVGETASGKLYMAKQWVKSTGAGCSAPPGLDQEMHKKRMGKIRFNQIEHNIEKRSRSLRLVVSHPNNTGMQRDQLSTMLIPENYITNVKVTFNKELVLEADTSFTLSENPNFTFTFDPEESGILRADFSDNLDNFFTLETHINGHNE